VKPQKVVIKKRQTADSTTLPAAATSTWKMSHALVRNRKDVKVVDAKTGQDVTRVTLTQIIVEDAKGQPTGLPLELLRQLIVAADRVGQEFIMWYLKPAFDAYQKVQSSVQSRFKRGAIRSPFTVAHDEKPYAGVVRSESERRERRIAGTAEVYFRTGGPLCKNQSARRPAGRTPTR